MAIKVEVTGSGLCYSYARNIVQSIVMLCVRYTDCLNSDTLKNYADRWKTEIRSANTIVPIFVLPTYADPPLSHQQCQEIESAMVCK